MMFLSGFFKKDDDLTWRQHFTDGDKVRILTGGYARDWVGTVHRYEKPTVFITWDWDELSIIEAHHEWEIRHVE